MGYSIATPLKSAKARDEMWAFMQEHYKPWNEVEPPEAELQPLEGTPDFPMAMAFPQGPTNPDYDFTWQLCRDGDLSYDNGKNRIGYNYGASYGPSGDYGWAVLRWMALRAGRVRKFKKKYGLEEVVPYTVYDGYEAWPVLVRSEWEDKVDKRARWCLVSPLGTKPVRREWIPMTGIDEVVARKVILHEFKSKDAILAMFRKQKLEEDWIAEAIAELEELPTTFEGTEPSWVRRVFDELQRLGCKVTLEKGPFVLDGWRKATADAIDHAYVAREKAIDAELKRLSTLWDAR
jgi:hypothetical protein